LSAALRIIVLAVLSILPVSGAPRAEEPRDIGVWQGRYACVQGETLLRLTILPEGGSPDRAYFYFYPPPGTNPGETGCFTLTPGPMDADGRLSLREGRWIDRPFGYAMVSLEGAIDKAGATFSGVVLFEGCGDFTLTRMPLEPDRAEACRPLIQ
jgi:hypothetical protein